MFCKNCGNELEEGWKVCPNCGGELQQSRKGEHPQDEKINSVPKSRKEIEKELIGNVFNETGGVVLSYGASGIAKDLERILQPGEEIIRFYHAYRNSLLGYLKSFRMFRYYMVCTSQRMIYIETGSMVFALFSFFRKVISYPYHEIISAESGKRVGIYSGKIIIKNQKNQMNFAMMDSKDAAELAGYLMNRKDR